MSSDYDHIFRDFLPLSITLPSLNRGLLKRAIENIADTTHCKYKIVVVSPLECESVAMKPGCKLSWWRDDGTKGPNFAHQEAFKFIYSGYVLAWVEDHELMPGWDVQAFSELAEADPFPSQIVKPPTLLGLRHADVDHVGTVFGRYYPYFPLMRVDRVIGIGGWLKGEYKRGFADCDLAMRVYAAGGEVKPTIARCVRSLPADSRKLGDLLQGEVGSTQEDLDLFVKTWAPQFGDGYDLSHVRGFNRDIIPT
jgi:hypothetical protein